MDANTPVIFTDGTAFFDELADVNIRHSLGFFILAPSGSGKTYFVNRQKEPHWVDGDRLWPAAGADLSTDAWNGNEAQVDEINAKSDVITNEAKKLGFWVIGSSNKFLTPDAIVLPPWDTHTGYIRKRQNENYDGGATSADLAGVQEHREIIAAREKQGVPLFESVYEATAFCEQTYKEGS